MQRLKSFYFFCFKNRSLNNMHTYFLNCFVHIQCIIQYNNCKSCRFPKICTFPAFIVCQMTGSDIKCYPIAGTLQALLGCKHMKLMYIWALPVIKSQDTFKGKGSTHKMEQYSHLALRFCFVSINSMSIYKIYNCVIFLNHPKKLISKYRIFHIKIMLTY